MRIFVYYAGGVKGTINLLYRRFRANMSIPKGKYTITEGQKMTINEAMRTYRLPNPTTPEDLECRWSKLLTFGDKVVIAGYYYQHNKPCYFGAAYEFLTDDHSCEGAIGLRAASGVEFEDDGHAIAWAMAH